MSVTVDGNIALTQILDILAVTIGLCYNVTKLLNYERLTETMKKSKNKKNRRYYREIDEINEIDDMEDIEEDVDEIEDFVSDETLEFLSLDDETIEAYNRAEEQKRKRSFFGLKKKERYDEEEEDDYDEEELDEDELDEEDWEEESEDEDWEDEDDIEEEEDEDDEDYDYEEGNFFTRIGNHIADMSTLDRVVTLFGCFILMAAIATGSLYASAKLSSKNAEAFAEVGTDINEIGIIGESGLLAVADAESARMLLADEVQTEEETQESEEQEGSVQVSMKLTSIQADIKIKFVNKKTNKLIGGLPFEVEVSGDNGKNFNLKDEDKDGIIYQTGIAAGTYTVKILPLEGEAYKEYAFPSQTDKIKVTDTITYKEVDVADEVKTEAEVNVAVEDTAKQDTVVESTLTDTVEWVESTKAGQDSDANYQEIQKADIVDPSMTGKQYGFRKLVEGEGSTGNSNSAGGEGNTNNPGANEGGAGAGGTNTETGGGNTETGSEGAETPGSNTGSGDTGSGGSNPGSSGTTPPAQLSNQEKLNALAPSLSSVSIAMKKGETTSLSVGVKTSEHSYTVEWSSNNTAVVTVSNGTISAQGTGSAVVSAMVKVGDVSTTLNCSVSVADNAPTYTIKSVSGSGTIQVGKTGNVYAETNPTGGAVSWSSSNTGVVKVDNNGTLTGVSVGSATITATCGSSTGTWTVNVIEAATGVTISGSGTIQVGKTGTVVGKTTPEGGKITWTSDNEKVVKVDSNGTLTGVSVGSATITGTCGDAKGTWKVTVVSDAVNDTTSKLKDKSGRQIYIKNAEGKYMEATFADYFKEQKFYLRIAEVPYQYTGWQSIDGYTYFFDKNGNKVTGEQVIQGAKYSFGSDGRLSSGSGTLGIDVSKWNGNIDWNAVKNSGVSYVIIRCGYRGSSTGALIEDPKFRSNIQGAKAAGLKVGVYFFSQAINEVEAVEEASMALNLIKGYGLNYPVFLDVESSGGRGDGIDAATRTAVCKAFCATIQNSGYSAGIYANKTWFTTHINTGSLTGYKIWLAQYASAPTYTATRYDMWQYSSKGSVSGISGNVDMNISYMNY